VKKIFFLTLAMSIILITGYLKIETVIADTTSKASFMYTLQSPAPLFNTVKATDTIVSGTGVAGASVSITFPNGSIQTITVESDGTWSIALPTNLILTVGDQLSATQIVGTGASAESVSTISTITVIPNNSGIAQSPTFDTISPNATTIKGTVPSYVSGSSVIVTFPNGNNVGGTVNSDSTWSVTVPGNINLVAGNQLTAIQISPNLENSAQVTTLVNSSQLQSAPPTLDTVRVGDSTISGTGITGSTIIVTFPNGTTSQTSVDTNDKFSLSIPSEISLNPKDIISATQIEPDKTISQAVTTSVLSNTNWSLPFTGSDGYKPLLLIIIGLLLTIILLKFSDSKKQK
jgi:hypothetical protein